MGSLLALVLIVLGAGWGSAFLYAHLRGYSRRLDHTVDHDMMARLLEDMDQLSSRLTKVEEEMDFFKELNSPRSPDRLPSPDRAEGEE